MYHPAAFTTTIVCITAATTLRQTPFPPSSRATNQLITQKMPVGSNDDYRRYGSFLFCFFLFFVTGTNNHFSSFCRYRHGQLRQSRGTTQRTHNG
jgi:hypothetical protein